MHKNLNTNYSQNIPAERGDSTASLDLTVVTCHNSAKPPETSKIVC